MWQRNSIQQYYIVSQICHQLRSQVPTYSKSTANTKNPISKPAFISSFFGTSFELYTVDQDSPFYYNAYIKWQFQLSKKLCILYHVQEGQNECQMSFVICAHKHAHIRNTSSTQCWLTRENEKANKCNDR